MVLRRCGICAADGPLTGTGDDTFSPTAPMARGMLVTVLYRLEGEPAVNGGKSFVDVSTCKWFENAVIWAAQNKIFEGYDEMHFGPEDNISREQMRRSSGVMRRAMWNATRSRRFFIGLLRILRGERTLALDTLRYSKRYSR